MPLPSSEKEKKNRIPERRPRSHFHVSSAVPYKSHVVDFREMVWNEFNMAILWLSITGFTWQLWDVRGCYGVYVSTLQKAPRRPTNGHVDPVTVTM